MIRAWWKRQSRWERVTWALVVLLLVAAGTVKPLVKTLAGDRLQMLLAVHEGYWIRGGAGGLTVEPDPWGNPLRVVPAPSTYTGVRFYSVGFNGRDEGGIGDDYHLSPNDVAKARHISTLPMALVALAGLPAWCMRGPYSRRRRQRRLVVEAWRAFCLGWGPLVLGYLLFAGLAGGPSGWLEQELVEGFRSWDNQIFSLLSTEASLAWTAALLCFLFALWWRLTRPLESEESHG